MPYFVLGDKLLECQHGKDRKLGAKRKYQEKRVNQLCLLAGCWAKANNSQLILTLVGGVCVCGGGGEGAIKYYLRGSI